MKLSNMLKASFFCLLILVPVVGKSGNISIIESTHSLGTRGFGESDIQVMVSGTAGALQFGDQASIIIKVANLGPDDQIAAGVVSLDFIEGLGFPTSATCNIEISVMRAEQRGFTDFMILWIIDDFLANTTQQCVITFPVSATEPGSETITFTHIDTGSDPNPNNDESAVTFQYFGLNGVPVPALSKSGISLLILLMVVAFVYVQIRNNQRWRI